jgi:2-isopropylmalate synthase
VKAFKKSDRELVDAIYSGVPAHLFGLEQVIEIGPLSGKSNVIYWLESRGITPTEEMVNRIFAAAKKSERILTEEELLSLAGPVAVRETRQSP